MFRRWLRKEPKGLELLSFVYSALLWKFTYMICVMWILSGVYLILGQKMPATYTEEEAAAFLKLPMYNFLLLAFMEEILFRAPLGILLRLKMGLGKVICSMLALSIFFGYLHGGIGNIFIQGMAGVILSLVFLKCGGYNLNMPKALVTTTLMHFSFNVTLVFIGKIVSTFS
jgi:membrane protease YdiL (CAAX protease family)